MRWHCGVMALSLVLGYGGAEAAAFPPLRLPAKVLPTVSGGRTALHADQPTVTVLAFVSTQCPISNGYIPTLKALAADYAGRNVRFLALNSNDGQGLAAMQTHSAQFQFDWAYLRDEGGQVARAVGATHCPEVCVFDGTGILRYRGRIDDRYVRRGGSARQPRQDDLRNALDAVLAGNAPNPAETEPLGCPILWAPADVPQPMETTTAAVTYTQHVAPLLARYCAECHQAGGVGPFPLTTYDDARRWADDIAKFTANRQMPPWKPVAGFGNFHNERRLSDDQIKLLADWLAGGCVAGPNDQPTPTIPAVANGWTMGQPDYVLEMPEPFTVAADGPDVYQCFVIPTAFGQDVYVSGIEVLPGNRSVVHHVIAFLDDRGASVVLDEKDPAPGYRVGAGYPGFVPSGALGGWAPGNNPHRLPDSMARLMKKDSYVVLQVHYHKTGKEELDQTRIGIYSARTPVTRLVFSLPVLPILGRLFMTIPPDDPNYEVFGTLTVPRDLVAVSVTPHMHLLGKDMKLTAHRPDGSTEPLVFIKEWDFNWQGTYQYRSMIHLPVGTRLDLTAHYDNSAANPNNPHQPPQIVRWGESTNEEMCIAFLEVAVAEEAQRPEDLVNLLPREIIRAAYLGRSDKQPAGGK